MAIDIEDEIKRMITAVRADRIWLAAEARRRGNPGMMIDAAACAIREKALREALEVVVRAVGH